MIVQDIEVGERTTLTDEGTRIEFYTKIEGPEGEVDLIWLIPENFTDEKSQQLADHFEAIMTIIGSEFERYN